MSIGDPLTVQMVEVGISKTMPRQRRFRNWQWLWLSWQSGCLRHHRSVGWIRSSAKFYTEHVSVYHDIWQHYIPLSNLAFFEINGKAQGSQGLLNSLHFYLIYSNKCLSHLWQVVFDNYIASSMLYATSATYLIVPNILMEKYCSIFHRFGDLE